MNDIRDVCSVPVTEVTYSQYSRNLTGMPNGNSYEFSASSQPGNRSAGSRDGRAIAMGLRA